MRVDSRLGLRTRRGAPSHLAEHMEDAPLDTGFGPHGSPCPFNPATAIAHEDVRRGDAGHKASPVLGVLGSGQMAPDHVGVGARDEDDALSRESYAVHAGHVMDPVARRDDRPYLPEPMGALAERARAPLELCLRELAQKPGYECLEPSGRRVVFNDRRASARLASPSLRACPRLAVLLHLRTADAASPFRHRSPRQKPTFLIGKASLSRRVKSETDTLSCL